MRVRGVRGGVITPHRSMVGLPWTAFRLLTTLLLSLGGLLLLYAALPGLGRFWQEVFEQARDFLGLQVPLGDQILTMPGGLEFTLPVLAGDSGAIALFWHGRIPLCLATAPQWWRKRTRAFVSPSADGEFIAQLATFSSLEQLTHIQTTLTDISKVLGVKDSNS